MKLIKEIRYENVIYEHLVRIAFGQHISSRIKKKKWPKWHNAKTEITKAGMVFKIVLHN